MQRDVSRHVTDHALTLTFSQAYNTPYLTRHRPFVPVVASNTTRHDTMRHAHTHMQANKLGLARAVPQRFSRPARQRHLPPFSARSNHRSPITDHQSPIHPSFTTEGDTTGSQNYKKKRLRAAEQEVLACAHMHAFAEGSADPLARVTTSAPVRAGTNQPAS